MSKNLSPTLVFDVPGTCVAFNLGKAYRTVLRIYENEFKSSVLSSMQYGLLVHVRTLQPASTTAISAATGHDLSTLSRTLASLKNAGYIRETKSESRDKRLKLLEITPEGQVALDVALLAWERAQNTILETLGDEVWKNTLSTLHRLQSL